MATVLYCYKVRFSKILLWFFGLSEDITGTILCLNLLTYAIVLQAHIYCFTMFTSIYTSLLMSTFHIYPCIQVYDVDHAKFGSSMITCISCISLRKVLKLGHETMFLMNFNVLMKHSSISLSDLTLKLWSSKHIFGLVNYSTKRLFLLTDTMSSSWSKFKCYYWPSHLLHLPCVNLGFFFQV